MDQKGPGVTVVAHRGASKVAPENTLEAVRAALVKGVDMVECDVHLTKDNEVVVIHDHSVDRTTDGRGDVRDLTLQEIRKLNASNGMAGVMCTVPTLREWVRAVREGNRIPMIEIKGKKKLGLSGFYMEAYPGLAKRVLEVTESLDCKYDCVYQSFSQDYLRELRKLDSKVTLYSLANAPSAEFVSAQTKDDIKSSGIGCRRDFVTAGFCKLVHDLGLKVFVYTVDEPKQMKRIVSDGVDGIITNKPDVAVDVIKKGVMPPEEPSRVARAWGGFRNALGECSIM